MSESGLLLSTAYFPPVLYFSYLSQASSIAIEQHEHYSKQTYRNRCVIDGPNKLLTLTIPVVQGMSLKKLTKDVLIDYDFHWQKIHWRSIVSSYSNSAFFQYYQDALHPFFDKKTKYLIDHNEEILHTLLGLLHLKIDVQRTTSYEKTGSPFLVDLRDSIHPKKTDSSFQFKSYVQVFANKHAFAQNLSIIDLLFNEGNQSTSFLKHNSI